MGTPLGPRLRESGVRIGYAFKSVHALTVRERQFLVAEMVQIKGLMPLLMKQRNKQRWTIEDRAELRSHFQRLSNISPYLVVMVLPGSFVLLPALAWWLDRRRKRGPRMPSGPGSSGPHSAPTSAPT